jgi:hypothetical protein
VSPSSVWFFTAGNTRHDRALSWILLTFGFGAEEERASFAPAGAASAVVALFLACHYAPRRDILARSQ